MRYQSAIHQVSESYIARFLEGRRTARPERFSHRRPFDLWVMQTANAETRMGVRWGRIGGTRATAMVESLGLPYVEETFVERRRRQPA